MLKKGIKYETTYIDAWEKFKIDYEGASKVNKSKLQTYKGQFESLKMKEEENIA